MMIDHDMLSALPKTAWQTSSYSGGQGECVEIAAVPGLVPVRDSKRPEGPALGFERAAWTNFIHHLR